MKSGLSDNGLFNRTLSPGDSFSFTFTEHGIFRYRCINYPEMVGEVIAGQVVASNC